MQHSWTSIRRRSMATFLCLRHHRAGPPPGEPTEHGFSSLCGSSPFLRMALLREHHPARALPLRLASSGRVLQGPSGSLAGPLARHHICDSSGVTPVCHATAQWQAFMLEYPHVRYTDVDDFICKKSGDWQSASEVEMEEDYAKHRVRRQLRSRRQLQPRQLHLPRHQPSRPGHWETSPPGFVF